MKDTTFLLWRFEAIKICLYEIYLALALKVGVVLDFLATRFFLGAFTPARKRRR